MPDTGDGAPAAPTDSQTAEQKMRQALGLGGTIRTTGPSGGVGRGGQPRTPQQRPEQARQRHRFVQDGGVPVVVVNHRAEDGNVLKERVTELERLLDMERAQHAATRRNLQEAQAAANSIETRLVHAGLAHQEALNQERRALAVAQQRLNEAQAQLHTAGRRARAPEPVPAVPAPMPEPIQEPVQAVVSVAADADTPGAAEAATPSATAKKRGRPRTRPLPEPKPVRWWTPGFRAKAGN